MQEIFEPTDRQKNSAENLTKSITTGNLKKRKKNILKGPEIYDEVTLRNNELLSKLTNSIVMTAIIVETPADPIKSIKRQLSSTLFDENGFAINPHNPKNVIRREKSLTFFDSDGIVIFF